MELDTIVAGDCLDVMADMPDGCVDLIATDPPYGISYSSCGGPRVSKERKGKIKEETKIIGDDFINLDWFSEIYRVLRWQAALYCFCSFNSYPKFRNVLKQKGFELKTPLVWDKGNCGMGDLRGDYGNQVEIIIYATKGRHILYGGRDRNIIRIQRPADAYRLHPTQKPVELLSFLLTKSSQQGELIFDPFIGSGTTAVAALKLGRHFYGCDISPEYVELANERIEKAKLETAQLDFSVWNRKEQLNE